MAGCLARIVVALSPNAFYFPGSTIVILLTGAQMAALGLLADVIVKRAWPLNGEAVSPRSTGPTTNFHEAGQ